MTLSLLAFDTAATVVLPAMLLLLVTLARTRRRALAHAVRATTATVTTTQHTAQQPVFITQTDPDAARRPRPRAPGLTGSNHAV